MFSTSPWMGSFANPPSSGPSPSTVVNPSGPSVTGIADSAIIGSVK